MVLKVEKESERPVPLGENNKSDWRERRWKKKKKRKEKGQGKQDGRKHTTRLLRKKALTKLGNNGSRLKKGEGPRFDQRTQGKGTGGGNKGRGKLGQENRRTKGAAITQPIDKSRVARLPTGEKKGT